MLLKLSTTYKDMYFWWKLICKRVTLDLYETLSFTTTLRIFEYFVQRTDVDMYLFSIKTKKYFKMASTTPFVSCKMCIYKHYCALISCWKTEVYGRKFTCQVSNIKLHSIFKDNNFPRAFSQEHQTFNFVNPSCSKIEPMTSGLSTSLFYLRKVVFEISYKSIEFEIPCIYYEENWWRYIFQTLWIAYSPLFFGIHYHTTVRDLIKIMLP